MVEEVVPFVKDLVAFLMYAEHLLGCQLGLQTLILKDHEVVHLRYLLLYLDLAEIEVLTFVYQNKSLVLEILALLVEMVAVEIKIILRMNFLFCKYSARLLYG